VRKPVEQSCAIFIGPKGGGGGGGGRADPPGGGEKHACWAEASIVISNSIRSRAAGMFASKGVLASKHTTDPRDKPPPSSGNIFSRATSWCPFRLGVLSVGKSNPVHGAICLTYKGESTRGTVLSGGRIFKMVPRAPEVVGQSRVVGGGEGEAEHEGYSTVGGTRLLL